MYMDVVYKGLQTVKTDLNMKYARSVTRDSLGPYTKRTLIPPFVFFAASAVSPFCTFEPLTYNMS